MAAWLPGPIPPLRASTLRAGESGWQGKPRGSRLDVYHSESAVPRPTPSHKLIGRSLCRTRLNFEGVHPHIGGAVIPLRLSPELVPVAMQLSRYRMELPRLPCLHQVPVPIRRQRVLFHLTGGPLDLDLDSVIGRGNRNRQSGIT